MRKSRGVGRNSCPSYFALKSLIEPAHRPAKFRSMADQHYPLEASFNAADSGEVEKRKLEASRREKENRDFVRSILSTKQGRSWVWTLMAHCESFQDIIATDEATVNRFLGRRSIGLKLLAETMAADTELFTLMLNENGKANG